MNESARMPAFMNLFPEMNHAELAGYGKDIPSGLEHLFRPCIISDDADDPRILRRMDVFESVVAEVSQHAKRIHYSGVSRAQMLVESWMRSLETAEALAEVRNIDPRRPAPSAHSKNSYETIRVRYRRNQYAHGGIDRHRYRAGRTPPNA